MFRLAAKFFVRSSGNVFSHERNRLRLRNRTVRNHGSRRLEAFLPSGYFESEPNNESDCRRRRFADVMLVSGIFSFLNKREEPDGESELITTIKRAVLLIQRDEFKPAEQMLHVALKLAQEQQNADGITYIYDLLANLAFAQGQFSKAEKLFIQVMQRIIAAGSKEDDLKLLHMSLKLAKIFEEKKQFVEAEEGYKYCLKNLGEKVDQGTDEDTLLLWAMTLDWYARFLLDRERFSEALNYFNQAYQMSLKVNGEVHEQTVVLLNDLGTISYLIGDADSAMTFLTKAVEIGKHLPNMWDLSSVYINLGNIYMQKKMFEEAKKHCKEGWQNATRHNNQEGVNEANVCLQQLSHMIK
ncbi:tetratricopeptide repeat protein 19 homolog, mitochondrial [Cimex lectularius]|uniref:Tetratricopeptide repeat protein 19 homolog, mitochondrial n=1 Tax=Cimex lectularius TaxID=79782 RepID=A0A8I6RTM4_CIMLE|nr:tetratricopeptide repeat protein 19 homolog, mitochondrial [Cimex lectularius]